MTQILITAEAVRSATPDADAVLVANGRISAIGRAEALRSADAVEVAFPGATIVPGLRDAHMHPIGYAASLSRPNLKNAADFAEIVDILASAASTQAPGTAIAAMRLDDESLAEGRLPDRHLLDLAVPDRPAIAVRYCGHVTVANTTALQLAGIGADTPDPPGGTIDRDAAGLPTGVLRETAAEVVSSAVRGLAPPVTADDLVAATTALAGLGLTGVGAIVSTDQGCWAGAGSELDVLIEAAPRIPITVRVLVIASSPAELEAAAQQIDGAEHNVSFLGLKVFGDGSFGGHTAAMYEPFTDRPDQTGTLRIEDWVAPTARAALAMAGRVGIHAIGDRANAEVLDLMEDLIAGGADPALLRIEHASVLTAADIGRFGRLGVTAVVQPAFLASETGWLESRVGAGRMERTYAFRSLLDAGTLLAGSSDCPVEPPHPLLGMATAIDRCDLTPAESLTSSEALDLFTSGSATAMGENASLEPGAPATFTVLDRDPVASSADQVRTIGVEAVWVEGRRVEVPGDQVYWVG